MLSQWILVAAFIFVGLYLLKARRTSNQQAIRRLFIVLALGAGLLAVLFPAYTNVLAGLVGVGRGADLLLYTFVVFGLFYAVYQYRRQLWQEKVNTDLARALTLVQAKLDQALADRDKG
jgi:hypothetical protein